MTIGFSNIMRRPRCFRWLLFLGIAGLASGATRVRASQTLEFSWSDSFDPNIVSHNVYCGTQSGVYGYPVNVPDLVTPLLPGFEDGSTNYFAVSAVDVFGNESGLSSEVVFTVPPPASLGLQAQAATDAFAAVQLSWSPSPEFDVYGYFVQYGTQSGVYTSAQEFAYTTAGTIYGLASGTTYYFVIAPIDYAGGIEAFATNEVQYVAPGLAPVVLTAQPAANLPGVELRWNTTTNEGAYGYNVYCGTDSSDCAPVLNYVLTNDIVLTDLAAGQTNYFEVTSVDAYGNESPVSNVASAVASLPGPMTLQWQTFSDDNGNPYTMEIFNPSPVYGDWEIDASPDLQNWNYEYSAFGLGSGYDVDYWVPIDPTVPQMFYRVVQ